MRSRTSLLGTTSPPPRRCPESSSAVGEGAKDVPLGPDSLVGEGHVDRTEAHQRPRRNFGRKALVSERVQATEVSLPADGFFEWTEVDPAQPDPNLGLAGRSLPSAKPYKQPFHIRLRSGEPFAFAGLFEVWETPEAGPLETCAIITTEPNELLGKVHNRMPAILAREDYGLWLDDEAQSPGPLLPLLAPYPADPMEMVPVTRLMSNPRFDDPVCVAPLV